MALTPKQVKAIAALLDPQNRTNEAAAVAAGCSKRVLQTWLAEGDFAAALQSAQSDMIGAATMRMTALTGLAVDALADNLDEYTNDKQRLVAAVALLDRVLRFKELAEFETRIAALESTREST